jgi:hypothetical protein
MPILPPPSPPSQGVGIMPGVFNLAAFKAMVLRYHKENEANDLMGDVCNDAVESLWRSILLVSLGQFMGGPVTSLSIAAGSERQTIIAVADPLVAPVCGQVANPNSLGARTIDVCYTLVTDSGSETLQSPTTILPVADMFSLDVTPPTYVSTVIGWNLYACLHDGRMALQNDQPLGFSTHYQEPQDTGISDAPDLPSPPLVNNTADNIFYIRLLQVQNPDSTWTTWQAGDLDGLLMSRASKSVASSSTFQGYAYDVINSNQIEIRPAAGTTLNPRYFYVVKPRRLRYDNSIIPFTTIAATEFLKMYADAALDLSNHEYTGYGMKAKKAEAIRQEILQGLNTQSTTKQKSITPFFRW